MVVNLPPSRKEGASTVKAWEYYAVTTSDGAVYCIDCIPDGVDVESDEVRPIFASDEVDCYPVCDRCGRVHDYMGLTSDGEEY